ncbi:hypothetical protein ELQ92_11525 [Labedella populi]|uniref:General stress protein 17M-like domain-containing protein n=1 Tax=Labedella populi TaxID=2498850 RepID=A0A444QBZ7_9MICO|nr:general stress protein [Labedella populi]RWZ61590.1 hypothetical protein ELQ92_11525 [Labedella populi]
MSNTEPSGSPTGPASPGFGGPAGEPLDPSWKRTVASFSAYLDAQAAVDYLSDQEFPVERVSIVGFDVRTVEDVSGRLTKGTAALRGLAGGAWFGLLAGLLFSLFVPDVVWIGIILTALALGALWGALFGFLGHLATGGRRDFTSVQTLQAGRYEVQVEAEFATRAEQVLARRTS